MAKLEKGLIQIYTGDGKGKSTAAFGQAIRAIGQGLKVVIVQFMKAAGGYGELNTFKKLEPDVQVFTYGTCKWVAKGEARKEDIQEARDALYKGKEFIDNNNIDMLIYDEINNALYFELLTLKEVEDVLKDKPDNMEIILTGRNAPEELIEKADLVTEMKEIKHHYQQGVEARKGIEY